MSWAQDPVGHDVADTHLQVFHLSMGIGIKRASSPPSGLIAAIEKIGAACVVHLTESTVHLSVQESGSEGVDVYAELQQVRAPIRTQKEQPDDAIRSRTAGTVVDRRSTDLSFFPRFLCPALCHPQRRRTSSMTMALGDYF